MRAIIPDRAGGVLKRKRSEKNSASGVPFNLRQRNTTMLSCRTRRWLKICYLLQAAKQILDRDSKHFMKLLMIERREIADNGKAKKNIPRNKGRRAKASVRVCSSQDIPKGVC